MVDVLIVGAGAVGLSLAYELSAHGLRVRVVDRDEPGRQASWAGAGILPAAASRDTARDAYAALCGLSHQLHPQWAAALAEQTGLDTGYRPCGGIHVARGAGEAAALDASIEQLGQEGIRAEPLTLDALRELEPAVQPPGHPASIRAAHLVPDEAQLRNPRHLKALIAASQKRGVEITGQVDVHELRIVDARVSAIESSAGLLQADRICITTGAWTRRFLAEVGIQLHIRPWRGQIALLAGQAGLFRRILSEGPRYLVPRDDGLVVCGSTVEDVGFDNGTTPEAISDLVQFAVDLVPALQSARLERTWAGLRPGTGDGLPFLGPVPGVDNLWVAAGHFRSGLFLSPGTAVVMSQLIRGQVPEVDLRPFRLDRE
jgi:glycine oxidase